MLTDAIKAMGLKRSEFAELLGIGRAYLSSLETGKKRPSLELAVRIDRITNGLVPVASWISSQATPNHNESSNEQSQNHDAA